MRVVTMVTVTFKEFFPLKKINMKTIEVCETIG